MRRIFRLTRNGNVVAKCLATTFLFASLITGCTSAGPSTLSVEEALQPGALADVDMVIDASHYDNDRSLNASGRLLLLHKDGRVNAIRKSRLYNATPSWTATSLNFYDSDNDYHFDGTTLTIHPQQKASLFEALLVHQDGDMRTVAFNRGYQEDGSYREELIHSSLKDSSLLVAPRPIEKLAACDERTFALWKEVSNGDLSIHTTLAEVFNQTGKGVKKIATYTELAEDNVAGFPGSAPCLDGKIFVIAGQVLSEGTTLNSGRQNLRFPLPQLIDNLPLNELFPEGATGPLSVQTLEKWDVTTGERTIIPLRTENGHPIDLNLDQSGFALYSQASLLDESVVWLGGNGALYRTSVSSGETQAVNGDIASPTFWQDNNYAGEYKDGKLTLLVEEISTGTINLYVFDLMTGRMLSEKDISYIRDHLDDGHIIRGIATAPKT